MPNSENRENLENTSANSNVPETPIGNEPNDGEPIISVGEWFYHNQSKNLYQVTGFLTATLSSGVEMPFVVYVGKDYKERKLSVIMFLEKFSKTFAPLSSVAEYNEAQNRFSLNLGQPESGEEGEGEVPLGDLYEPSERYSFDNMILHDDTIESIKIGMNSILKSKEMNEIWNLSKIMDNPNRNILNFFGGSGTGKTMAARCLAKSVNKKLLQVDYAQIVDKYVGETGKKISQVFAIAKAKDAIILFDEADSLLSKRVDMSVNSDYANSVNTNRNVLMQELDKFDGIVIMSTNFFNNYDSAMLRRISRHIEFELPNSEMREKLFKVHLPENERTKSINYKELAQISKEMSGGDILNVSIEAIKAASLDENPENWVITQDIVKKQIKHIKNAKKQHEKSGSNNRISKKPFIGFETKKNEVK